MAVTTKPQTTTTQGECLISRQEVERRTRLSRSTIYQLIAEGRFVKPVKLPGTRSVAWVASEIDAYIAGCIAERDAA